VGQKGTLNSGGEVICEDAMMELVDPKTVGMSAERLKRLDASMQAYVDRGQLAGALTTLVRRGKLAHYGVYGSMDLAVAKPMQKDAIFRIFSMTKPITALAILMLHEEGHFHLQYPIGMFIPALGDMKVLIGNSDAGMDLAPINRPITIHDLLTHTSGLGYGLDAVTEINAMYQQAAMLRMDECMADKVQRIAQLPLHHQPGAYYTYSVSTDILGLLVEIISGMPLDAFLRQRIFEPLGMVDTDFYVPVEKCDRLAALYAPGPDGGLFDIANYPGDPNQFPFGLWTDKSVKPPFLSGGGGLVSTMADYLRFAFMLRNGGVLDGVRMVSRKTIELMTAPHLRPEQVNFPGVSYGLGVTVLTDPAQAQMLGSPGAYEAGGAAHTNFWYDPQEDLIGVLMTQYIFTTPLPVSLDFKTLAEGAIED
jgi:CubicO group peptidase (beta-lactamase class C family)